jgi:hypothetical protein
MMADAGWGHGRPAETDTGILQVLMSYVTQGGQLYGARRWMENPLTLTHVRWQGPNGASAEAFRPPESDDNGTDGEGQVWVQLALTMPATYAASSGAESPWLPLAATREKAQEWGHVLRHARMNRHSQVRQSFGESSLSMPRMPAAEASGFRRPGSSFSPPGYSSQPTPRRSVPSVPASVDMEPTMRFSTTINTPPGAHDYEEERQFTNGWQRGQMDMLEVVVIPCVDVELPPTMDGVVSSDYRRDFARDVTMHFSRAARSIPQVREVRGWMRGPAEVHGHVTGEISAVIGGDDAVHRGR